MVSAKGTSLELSEGVKKLVKNGDLAAASGFPNSFCQKTSLKVFKKTKEL